MSGLGGKSRERGCVLPPKSQRKCQLHEVTLVRENGTRNSRLNLSLWNPSAVGEGVGMTVACGRVEPVFTESQMRLRRTFASDLDLISFRYSNYHFLSLSLSLSAPAPLIYDGQVCLPGTPILSPTRSHLFRSLNPPRCLQAADQSLCGENPAPSRLVLFPWATIQPSPSAESPFQLSGQTRAGLPCMLSFSYTPGCIVATADPPRLRKAHSASAISHLRSYHAGSGRYDHLPRLSHSVLVSSLGQARSWDALLDPHSCQSE